MRFSSTYPKALLFGPGILINSTLFTAWINITLYYLVTEYVRNKKLNKNFAFEIFFILNIICLQSFIICGFPHPKGVWWRKCLHHNLKYIIFHCYCFLTIIYKSQFFIWSSVAFFFFFFSYISFFLVSNSYKIPTVAGVSDFPQTIFAVSSLTKVMFGWYSSNTNSAYFFQK